MASSDGRDDNCAGTSADAGGVAGGHSGGELRASSWDHTVDSCSASSTCTPYWDSDDDDPGPRPSELYGKFTWKIEKFSEISNRELRSNVFEVGGYKWYILVYPQGCDVCNHLSLFLCVSDYDKLLPGWSHFAQFTIAVVNKDPKKSKYSDTLHRFCKKEHDWGWKKFMELSKVLDGFIVADILVIKAQVQVIRENPSRPFRCLDIQYRRELVRVYLTNVEGICRRFVEEKRERLAKMIEDTTKWSSFRTFWSAIDQSFRHRLSREKTDVILKAIVKRFFNEKEVTSTLVMDALYSGCKALNYRTKGKKEKSSNLDGESVYPVVCVEKDQFVLADDVLALLERAATEQLPPSKEDKAPQNRTKDCSGDDFAKDSVERDERRLTELGKRTIEIFVLAHLFGRVEVAYKEAIALKRQEELIREEEAAGQAEIEFKAKREAAEKDKKSKKKQAKQRRNNKKDKSRGREEKTSSIILQKEQLETSIRKLSTDNCSEDCATPNANILALADEDDDLSGVDTTDNVVGTLGPAIEDGEAYRGDWDRDGSETHQSMEAGFSGDVSMPQAQSGRAGRKQQSTIDDSSSTCSTDSLASVVPNGSYKGKNALGNHNQLLNRGKIKSTNEKRGKSSSTVVENENHKASSTDSSMMQETSSSMAGVSSETVILSLKERVQWLEQRLAEKEEEVLMLQEKLSLQQHQIDEMKSNKQAQDKAKELSEKKDSVQLTTQSNDCKRVSPCVLVDGLLTTQNKESMDSPSTSSVGNNILHQRNNLPRSSSTKSNNPCKNDIVKTQVHHTNTTDNSRPTQKSSAASDNNSNSNPGTSNGSGDVSGLSRPSSAPLIPGVSKPNVPIVPLQTAPSLSRSVSASGRLGVAETTGLNSTMLSQSNPVTPSYKMAAVGKIRSSYNGSVPFPAANSSQGSNMSNAALVMQNVTPSTVSSSSTTPAMKQESQRTAMSNECSSTQTRVDVSSPSFKGPGIPTQTSSVNVQGKEHTAPADAHQPERPVGFTFGSVTPEMLNRQRAQDYAQSLDDSLSRIDENSLQGNENQHKNTLEHYVNQQSQGLQNLNFFHSRSGQDSHESRTQSTSNSTQAHKGPFYSPYAEVRQPHPVASEEFPHIDIINDLLDDEHYRGKALSMMMQQSDGHHPHRRVPFSNFERLNHNHMLDMNVVKGERLDISRLQDEGMYQLHSSDNASIGMREGLHMLPPYSPYAQSFNQQGGMFDGVPHHWPITSGDFAGGSMNGNAYGPMSPHMAYPMHANPMSLGDCSSFSSGQTDYAMFSPRKDM